MKFQGKLTGKIEIPFVVEANNLDEAKEKALAIPVRREYIVTEIAPMSTKSFKVDNPKSSIFTPAPAYKPSEWELRGDHNGTFE